MTPNMGLATGRTAPRRSDTKPVKSKFRKIATHGLPQEETNWRCDAPAWTIPNFFAMLREQFERLRFIPVNSRQVIDSYSGYSDNGEMESMLQRIYQDHGWPDLEHYRNEECIQAVKLALAEHYPDFELS